MIDLHCHILPGLDDGPANLEESLEMARLAALSGTHTIAATPHIRDDHPFDPEVIGPSTEALNGALDQASIAVRVVTGGEVALSKTLDLDDDVLRSLCLGAGSCLLVESPYTPVTDLLESNLFHLQVRGFRPLLAHPERSPSFLEDKRRVSRLVERGVQCSVTAGSLAGRFGGTVRKFAVTLLKDGLIHNVASDAHGPTLRTPDLTMGLEAIEEELPEGAAHGRWLTQEAPAAMLAGEDLPARPQSLRGGRGRWPLRRRANPSPRPEDEI